jgi:Tfp pilus assembly protein PilN
VLLAVVSVMLPHVHAELEASNRSLISQLHSLQQDQAEVSQLLADYRATQAAHAALQAAHTALQVKAWQWAHLCGCAELLPWFESDLHSSSSSINATHANQQTLAHAKR